MIENEVKSPLVDDIPGLVDYANVPRPIGALISAKGAAMLHLCETVYSVEDVYLMLEVLAVDSHNRRLAEEHARRKQG
jgi:hypothetical protein